MMIKDNKIKLLDYGHVRLVSYMQPVTLDSDWSGDMEIVRNARVSYNAERRKPGPGEEDADKKLINFLKSNEHTSPFESMVFTFDVKCPIFVARQWIRHRTWSYNEVSARYTPLPDEMYIPEPWHMGVQSSSNKQMRNIVLWKDMSNIQRLEASTNCSIIANANKKSYKIYKELLSAGVPRELARGVLPLNIYTHFFGTIDLHNLMHFLKLRLDRQHAQYEIVVYAEAMLKLVEPIVPFSIEAFKKYVLHLPKNETIDKG